MLVKCYKSFYLRPLYIAKSLMRMRRLGELGRKVRAGLSVMSMTANQKVFYQPAQAQSQDRVPDAVSVSRFAPLPGVSRIPVPDPLPETSVDQNATRLQVPTPE